MDRFIILKFPQSFVKKKVKFRCLSYNFLFFSLFFIFIHTMSAMSTFERLFGNDPAEDYKMHLTAMKGFLRVLKKDKKQKPRVIKKRRVVKRGRTAGLERLMNDYFSENPVYSDAVFRRRYRMRKSLFLRITEAVTAHDSYFEQKYDAANVIGFSPIQKVTAAMRQLAYGVGSDAVDETFRIAETTARESLKRFAHAVVAVYKEEYMRTPTQEDVDRLLAINEERGFPGMLGSIDCMHWRWKNCPTAHHGQFTGKSGRPTIILEAVASQDLWIWHSFFGLPGALNDINVLHRSPIFAGLAKGDMPEVKFTVNGNTYDKGYYLADGIYPRYATLVKTLPNPQSQKKKVSHRKLD